ncbi:esterase/lipase family protein [Jeotgalibacillus proteolyticus]|uniref:Triacylglycerol lipase n=1 Tax=Jeotgalibacillus proteolyticus TaxID=2082395 RepID=A0A2S5G8S7_9BACL|nr:hypothetical protein [Jeotgalibacillus proteolyticus]PPA69321.1 hypothetical protein C4B60_16115 [Jeotgalibacillus proteolyticus]
MRKRISVLAAMLMFSITVPSAVSGGGFNPPGNSLVPGTISIGTEPPGLDPNKPVVVFVQGLNNDSALWYVNNDMYNRAFQAGYQTAFVELNDSGGTPKSYWDNGAMLAGQLESVSSYFGGKKLVIVAFSKGGVDTQVALIHEGKHPLVSNVITLGSPHHGSELADLANSTTLGWLAELIGQNSEGTQSLQTGTMNYFRSITDNRPEVNQNRYLTLAGNRAGPIFSSYWYGGAFISGPSDGAVSVASSLLPYGSTLGVGSWNHDEVNKGVNTFPLFQRFLTQQQAPAIAGLTQYAEPEEEPALDVLVRGGNQDGVAAETFYVENEAEKLVLNWLSATPHTEILLTKPGQSAHEVFSVTATADETMFFQGAWHHIIEIDKPESGEWKAQTISSGPSAYALMVTFDSSLNDQLALTPDNNKKRWSLKTGHGALAHSSAKVFADIAFIPGNGRDNKNFGQSIQRFKQRGGTSVRLPEKEGTYNMTVEVEGVTPSGQPFQRTMIKSVYVDELGDAY